MLKRFAFTVPKRRIDTPIAYAPPEYGRRGPQWTDPPSQAPALSTEQVSRVRQIVGVALYYARSIDPLLLLAVNRIATGLAAPTTTLLRSIDRLVGYMAQHQGAVVTFCPSAMKLMAHTDASFCSERASRSRAAHVMWIGDDDPLALDNAIVDANSQVITTVCASATEAEYVATYLGAQPIEHMRNALDALGHPQAASTIVVDNLCARGIAHREVTQRRTKSILLRYHWVRDRVDLGHLAITWAPAEANVADPLTKPIPGYKLRALRSRYLTDRQLV
jgi:hypothetical protein